MHKPLLAIETTGTYCSVALVNGDHCYFLQSERKRSHADELLSIIDSLLNQASLTLPQCASIAVNVGPGSFTGIRIGIAVAQGLGFGAGISTCAVSALQAMVWQSSANSAEGNGVHGGESLQQVWAPLMHAREDEFYFGEYQLDAAGFPILQGRETVVLATELQHWLEKRASVDGDFANTFLVGEGWEKLGLPEIAKTRVIKVSVDARTVAELGRFKVHKQMTQEPDTLLPSYLKDEMHYRTVNDDNPSA